MSRKTFSAALMLCLLSPAIVGAREPSVYTAAPARLMCDAASGVIDLAGNVVPGALRKRCDALWSHALRNGGVGGLRYGDFIGQCARSCAAPRALTQVSNVTQLDTLGTQAAQSAAGGAGAASGAAAGAGGGLSTALVVGGGVAAAAGIGVAVSHGSPAPSDPPASP